MKCLVTGAAGFIGSHLCEHLLQAGNEVVGLDTFIPYYPRAIKEANIAAARRHRWYTFAQADLRSDDLTDLLNGVEYVFHLAAMPGLPRSWTDFELYEGCNVSATRRLLEAAMNCNTLQRLVLASTSSVYGRFASGDESMPTRPISPYGVTKLAAEHLARAYSEEFGLPLVVLRYFSVYGPRQRPDMGYHKFVNALLHNEPITVFGDGQQVRGNTYINDCVAATMLASQAPAGETFNVGGGETASVWDIIRKLESIIGRRANIVQKAARAGDQRYTCADVTRLTRQLNWKPTIGLDEGLAAQVAWHNQSTGLSRAA
jgi:nucleoside-diphosphate-sugar epimerase